MGNTENDGLYDRPMNETPTEWRDNPFDVTQWLTEQHGDGKKTGSLWKLTDSSFTSIRPVC